MLHRLSTTSLRHSHVAARVRATDLRVPFAPSRQHVRKARLPQLNRLQAGFGDAQTQLLVGGAAVLATLLGSLAWFQSEAASKETSTASTADTISASNPTEAPRNNAVVVFGATGRLGRLVVQQLLSGGRQVVAAVRSKDKAQVIFGDLLETSGSSLFVEQVDVTNSDTLTAEVFQGVTQAVIALGPVFGPQPGGGFGTLDGMTSERVEAEGIANIVAAAAAYIPKQLPESATVLPMATAADLAAWQRLDDVIMGGQSSSTISPAADGSGAVWTGDLILDGGGFCGTRTQKLGPLDLSAYDGIRLRVSGDGQTVKLNVKTEDQEETPDQTYQATFDTVASGGWTDVFIPWHEFVCVKRAQSDPEGPALDARRVSTVGLVLSRFEFNKMPNPDFKAGPFELRLEGGIMAYKKPPAQLVMISSAGVERNALIGDDVEKRKVDIPIVRLNPGGTLNYKYAAEATVRASGYPYSVIRPTGMSDTAEEGSFLLEADQGDTISGTITREEVAAVVEVALSRPEAVGKTFELRRNEARDAKGVQMGDKQYLRLFLKLALDKHRWRVGLAPFPLVVPPPPPPTAEETQAVLNDPRVQASAPVDAAAREKDNAATAAAVKKEKVAVKA